MKKKDVLCLKTAALLLLIISVFPTGSYAYLDPGTGSYIFQLLIAGAIGGLFTLKIYWNKITAYFKNIFSKEK